MPPKIGSSGRCNTLEFGTFSDLNLVFIELKSCYMPAVWLTLVTLSSVPGHWSLLASWDGTLLGTDRKETLYSLRVSVLSETQTHPYFLKSGWLGKILSVTSIILFVGKDEPRISGDLSAQKVRSTVVEEEAPQVRESQISAAFVLALWELERTLIFLHSCDFLCPATYLSFLSCDSTQTHSIIL